MAQHYIMQLKISTQKLFDFYYILENWETFSSIKYFVIFSIKFSGTPLYCAVENKSIEIVQLLLQTPNIDVNIGYIFIEFIIL